MTLKEFWEHIGIEPGEEIEVIKEEPHRITIMPARKKGSIHNFIGCLAGKTDKVATLEEIKKATEDGWAGLVKFD